ncbi:hypothetical protein BW247_00480 [Acidihalobacter ferrooxydans]|uniref:FAD-binding FR-type domain-containing protein n=1 Tax=Acidihalobacter ferrooxydans TaxID=1765967 RepID=A0A1P8UL23_9GAMM|nr:hypothetical protein BW247_00480 [Acidihalobacter ferrooxydans]
MPEPIPARIAQIRRATPTVTVLWLEYGDRPYRFLPGQWIDLYVSLRGERRVGGYSITSTRRTPGRIRIAVKDAEHHPVTRWLGHAARVGDEIAISEGQGDFHYAPAHGERLVLLAGGIGITPLVGIAHEVCETRPQAVIDLFYSAARAEQLLFRAELDALAAAHCGMRCHYVLTRQSDASRGGHRGRMLDVLDACGDTPPQATYYFCGPRGFVDDLATGLAARGIPPERLIYERWW